MFALLGVPLLYLAVLLIMIIAGYIIKNNVIKILKSSTSLNSEQIESGIKIINTIYFSILLIILLTILTPFIINISYMNTF